MTSSERALIAAGARLALDYCSESEGASFGDAEDADEMAAYIADVGVDAATVEEYVARQRNSYP